jgi:hypothetical protein
MPVPIAMGCPSSLLRIEIPFVHIFCIVGHSMNACAHVSFPPQPILKHFPCEKSRSPGTPIFIARQGCLCSILQYASWCFAGRYFQFSIFHTFVQTCRIYPSGLHSSSASISSHLGCSRYALVPSILPCRTIYCSHLTSANVSLSNRTRS